MFLAELLILTWMYAKISVPGRDGEWIVWLTYVVLTVLILYSMYTPNIFGRGELSDSYHGHAYFNSVYNIYQGMPYTHNVTSIYGHYGLFFKIPMELVHGDFKAFVAMVAGIGAFAHICAFLILELLVKSRVLRVLGALAVTFPVLGMRGGFYWQVCLTAMGSESPQTNLPDCVSGYYRDLLFHTLQTPPRPFRQTVQSLTTIVYGSLFFPQTENVK